MRQDGHRSNGDPRADDYRYSVHERMLDRYGIRYICQHPEILFYESDVPKTGLVGQFYKENAYTGHRNAASPYLKNLETLLGDDADDLLRRLNEAYRILREIFFTPYCPATDDGKTS